MLGLVLLAVLTIAVGPRRIAQALSGASPLWLAAIALLACASLLLGALNVWLLLRRLAQVEFALFSRAYLASWAASLVIPGQLGDITQVALLRRGGVPVASSGAAYLLDKTVSLAFLASVATYGLGRYTRYDPLVWLAAAGLIVASLAMAAVGVLRSAPPQHPWLAKGHAVGRRAVSQILLFRAYPLTLGTNILLTATKWMVTAMLYLAAFHAVGADIGFEAAATIPVMSSLVGYVPLTVAGLGSMEITAVVLFGSVGIDAPTVVGVYLLLRIAMIVSAAVLLGALELRTRPGQPA